MSRQAVRAAWRKFLSIGLCVALLASWTGYLTTTKVLAAALALVNPGFEEGKTGWTQVAGTEASVTVDTTAARIAEGSRSLKIVDSSASTVFGLVSDKVAASAGNEYTATAKFYQTGRTAGYANIGLIFYDAEQKPITPVQYTAGKDGTASYLNNQWQDLTANAVAPVGTVFVSVAINTPTSYVSTGAWFDAIGLAVATDDLEVAGDDAAALQIGFAPGEDATAVKSNLLRLEHVFAVREAGEVVKLHIKRQDR